MPGLNRVQLIGYLGRDPETRFTPTGKKICRFSVAVSRRRQGADGEAKETTDWFNIEAWGRLGEVCQAYLNKGRLVFVEGRLQTDRVERDGEAHYYTKVVAQQMQMLDRRQDEPDAGEAEPIVDIEEIEPGE